MHNIWIIKCNFGFYGGEYNHSRVTMLRMPCRLYLKVLGLIARSLLSRYESHSTKGRRPPPLDEDHSYLANQFVPILEEELDTLVSIYSTYLACFAPWCV